MLTRCFKCTCGFFRSMQPLTQRNMDGDNLSPSSDGDNETTYFSVMKWPGKKGCDSVWVFVRLHRRGRGVWHLIEMVVMCGRG